MNLNNLIEHPTTIDKAVDRLLVILSDIEKEQIKTLSQNDLELLQKNSFGNDIRNAFGLDESNTALLGHRNTDDTVKEIIDVLWKRLQRRKSVRRLPL